MVDTDAGEPIELIFSEPLTGGMGPGKWTVVLLPESAASLGTARPVKVAGTIDGHQFRATLLPLGEGTHMLPLNAALKKTLGKAAGDRVDVHLTGRFA